MDYKIGPMEQWRSAVGYEGSYMVSDTGKIWSGFSKSELIQSPMKSGYLSVELRKDGIGKRVLVHRVVAMAYLSNENWLPQVNHKDGSKTNNNVRNLEWCTISENIRHAIDIGLKKPYAHWTGKKLSQEHAAKVVALLRNRNYSPRKEVIDTATGELFNSVKEAAQKRGIGYQYLKGMLNGNFKNKTTLRHA